MTEYSEGDEVLYIDDWCPTSLKSDIAIIVKMAEESITIEFGDGETIEVSPLDIQHYEG